MARQYTELQEEMDSVLGNLKEETTVLGKIKKQLKTVSKSIHAATFEMTKSCWELLK